mmetsp:Transcript_61371/g.161274  ORF Transcript_61371/g.161274 Transcript_61371/m.161274 type:complete len:205 (+) Transcript_61371:1542-2156(+)
MASTRSLMLMSLTMSPALGLSAKSGWKAMMMMAQQSWQKSTPIVRRPEGESPSPPLSSRTLFTTIVEERAALIATYSVEWWPSPNSKPSAHRIRAKRYRKPKQIGNCTNPVTIVFLVMAKTWWMSISKPIMKRKKMRPSELSSWMSTWLCTMSRTPGPTTNPARIYPRTIGCWKKWTMKLMSPAVVRVKAMFFINGEVPALRRR